MRGSPIRIVRIQATVHGRVLVEDAAASSLGLLALFHGYGQNAEDMLDEARQIPGAERWTRVAVQALHRFYTRDERRIVGSWMTREDRELAIADNIAYVDRAVAETLGPTPVSPQPLVYLGFSQGAAMAYRAAVLGARRVSGVVALGGDIPPDLRPAPAAAWPPVLIGRGARDAWYTASKLGADVEFLASIGVPHEVVGFDAAHEWSGEFRRAAGEWLRRIGTRSR
jgi:predicted esterase